MTQDQKRILQFCISEWRHLTSLEREIPRSTLYRLAKDLCGKNWLVHRRAKGYKITQRGITALGKDNIRTEESEEKIDSARAEQERPSKKPPVNVATVQRLLGLSEEMVNRLFLLYPPLEEVPTPTHQAIIELVLAEMSDRSWPVRDDHHLSFLNFGATFAWKTNSAKFCAHMVTDGETTPYILPLSGEGGCSLWVRKTSTGKIIFKREILEKPYICLDDYHRADRDGKRAAAHLLTGQMQIPVENEMQTIRCVTMVNLNPQKGETVFEKTGFDGPLIRRFIPCNLDAIELPNLKDIGEKALDSAAVFGPLEIKEPTSDCTKYRKELINYFEELFTEAGQRYIDVEGLLNIARGFIGYGFTPLEAVRYVLYKVSLPYSSLGWLQSKWLQGYRKGRLKSTTPITSIFEEESKKPVADQVERLLFLAQKRKQEQQTQELSKKISSFDSPSCRRLKEDLEEFEKTIDQASSKNELNKLMVYQQRFLQPHFQEAIEEHQKLELHQFVGNNIRELKKLIRCVEFLDSGNQPENIERTLENLGCIKRVSDEFGFDTWECLDGEHRYSELMRWAQVKRLFWIRIQRARKFLEKVLPALSPGKAEKLRRGLNPITILSYKWKNYGPPKSTHFLTLLNSIRCSFKFEIALTFKDENRIVLKRTTHPNLIFHSGKEIVRIDLGSLFKNGLLNSTPNGVSFCHAEITLVEPIDL